MNLTAAERAKRGKFLDFATKATRDRQGHAVYAELKQAHMRICGPVDHRQYEDDIRLVAKLCGV